MMDWCHPPMSLGKLNSSGCSLGDPGQLGIGAIGDHSGTVLRAYSKHAETGLAIEAEILALLEGLQ